MRHAVLGGGMQDEVVRCAVLRKRMVLGCSVLRKRMVLGLFSTEKADAGTERGYGGTRRRRPRTWTITTAGCPSTLPRVTARGMLLPHVLRRPWYSWVCTPGRKQSDLRTVFYEGCRVLGCGCAYAGRTCGTDMGYGAMPASNLPSLPTTAAGAVRYLPTRFLCDVGY
eukprot:3845283-Rhodomonas_salina.3